MTWIEKHRPKGLLEIKGQDEAIRKIKIFVENLKFGASSKKFKKAIILYGPPGTGKTTIAHAIALDTNSEIFELNASDLRNKTKLNEILRPAMEQKSLVKTKKIILVDEVDGISATDYGGVQELLDLIEQAAHPVIITANDVWGKKLTSLRQKSEMIQLKEINYNVVKNVLIEILRKEGLFVDNDTLTKIAVKVKGDLRAAINDLQTISKFKDTSELKFDERNKETDIFNALRAIFKTKPTEDILKIFDSVNMQIDEIILWMEENIPTEYHGEALAKAIEMLSKADIFKGRIYKQQYWRFLVYENIFLSYGISASKKEIKPGFTSYKKPTRILKIWMNNQRTLKKKSIAKKYAHLVHVGEKRAMQEFQIIKRIIKSNPKIQEELKLDEDELVYLNKID
ncbi:MAG: replication factor C large subunit [Nanoarchaeota archaeon]